MGKLVYGINFECKECEHFNQKWFDYSLSELEHMTHLFTECEECKATHEHNLEYVEDIVLRVLRGRTLAYLCEYLDSCWDLFDGGYITTTTEQLILEHMAEQKALQLWAIHRYANNGDVNFQYPFNEFIKEMREKLS